MRRQDAKLSAKYARPLPQSDGFGNTACSFPSSSQKRFLLHNVRLERSVPTAALGFRVHSGWAAVVVLCGPLDAPVVVDRRKIQLVKIFSYTFRQPYHTAEKMPRQDAVKFIRDVQREARRLALSSLHSLQSELAEGDFKIVRGRTPKVERRA